MRHVGRYHEERKVVLMGGGSKRRGRQAAEGRQWEPGNQGGWREVPCAARQRRGQGAPCVIRFEVSGLGKALAEVRSAVRVKRSAS